MPSAAGVSTSFAPYAASSMRRSLLMDSGMVSTTSYPRAAPIIAMPIPVLPLVGSTKTLRPGAISPRASAASIMFIAARSLIEPPGLEASNFTYTVAPTSSLSRSSLISGVSPMVALTCSVITTSAFLRKCDRSPYGSMLYLDEFPTLSNERMFSVCGVCGNISTGCISSMRYPCATRYSASRACVFGLHDI